MVMKLGLCSQLRMGSSFILLVTNHNTRKGRNAWMEAFIGMVFSQTVCYSLAEPFIHHPMKLSTEHLTNMCQMCKIKCMVM